MESPEGMTLKVVERKETEMLLLLPPPHPESAELSDEDLEKVAGGSWWGDPCRPPGYPI
jgi:hypothetical protein